MLLGAMFRVEFCACASDGIMAIPAAVRSIINFRIGLFLQLSKLCFNDLRYGGSMPTGGDLLNQVITPIYKTKF